MIKLDNYTIIIVMNYYLTYKSQLALSFVSKDFKNYIILKKYSFYNKFKHILRNVNKEKIIKILFESDQQFIEDEVYFPLYYDINNHKYGTEIREYIIKTKYFQYILKFIRKYKHKNIKKNKLQDLALGYGQLYSNYRPLQGLLIQMCIESIN